MEKMNENWVKKLNSLEVFYEVGHQYGMLITSYQATLRSKKAIKPDDVQEALLFLFRKIPSLRLCIRENSEKELWFVEMKKEIIDFQTLRRGSPKEVLESVTHTVFDSSKGPLWRARLIEEDNDTSCTLPHVSSEFPFQSQFIFGIHHGITDGVSNLKIMEFFLQILNQKIGGTPINEEQMGQYSLGEQTEELLAKRREELLSNPDQLDKVKNEVIKAFTNFNTMWIDAFGENKFIERKTIHLAKSLDLDTSNRLHQRWKSKGISINSGACSVMNLTMVEMMKERGLSRDMFDIGTLHGVNMRQYWSSESKFPLGLHIGMMRIYIETLSDASSDFWKYAKQFQDIIQDKVKSKWALNENIVQSMIFPQDIDKLKEFISNEDSPHTLLYAASSLGNVDRMIDSSGDHVQWTELSRTTAGHRLACPFGFNFQIFRGIFNYSIAYSSHLVSEDLASEIMNRITKMFLDISARIL